MTEGVIYTIEYNLTRKVKCYYGYDIVTKFTEVINEYDFDRVFFISDETVYKIYGEEITLEMEKGDVPYIEKVICMSEKEKKLTTVDHLCNWLIDRRITKDSIIISFGGGAIGNVVGLAASLIYRGVRYIEIPTTFLGMTDSTLSNKQAVNGDSGKNQLGTFYAPLFVWTDIKYAETENAKHIGAAVIEGVKNAFIQEMSILDELRSCFSGNEFYDGDCLTKMFEIITTAKNNILEKDPTEKKYSVVLEYGHTFGHAMEFLSSGRLIHGQAVAIGMCIAAQISHSLGLLSKKDKELHYIVLGELGLFKDYNTELIRQMTPEMILEAIEFDNKRTSKGIRYVILEKLGKCMEKDGEWEVPVSREIVIESIEKVFANLLGKEVKKNV